MRIFFRIIGFFAGIWIVASVITRVILGITVPLLAAADAAKAANVANPTVTVRLINDAKLDETYLSKVQDLIVRDYATADINIAWYEPSDLNAPAPLGIRRIHLVDGSVDKACGDVIESRLGCAFMRTSMAYIDVHSVMKLASDAGFPRSPLTMAHVIDHELMHMLGGLHTKGPNQIMGSGMGSPLVSVGWDFSQTEQVRKNLLAEQVASR